MYGSEGRGAPRRARRKSENRDVRFAVKRVLRRMQVSPPPDRWTILEQTLTLYFYYYYFFVNSSTTCTEISVIRVSQKRSVLDRIPPVPNLWGGGSGSCSGFRMLKNA